MKAAPLLPFAAQQYLARRYRRSALERADLRRSYARDVNRGQGVGPHKMPRSRFERALPYSADPRPDGFGVSRQKRIALERRHG